eukprot:1156818-Pelagomonas_calceolata.AAC.5
MQHGGSSNGRIQETLSWSNMQLAMREGTESRRGVTYRQLTRSEFGDRLTAWLSVQDVKIRKVDCRFEGKRRDKKEESKTPASLVSPWVANARQSGRAAFALSDARRGAREPQANTRCGRAHVSSRRPAQICKLSHDNRGLGRECAHLVR